MLFAVVGAGEVRRAIEESIEGDGVRSCCTASFSFSFVVVVVAGRSVTIGVGDEGRGTFAAAAGELIFEEDWVFFTKNPKTLLAMLQVTVDFREILRVRWMLVS